jgi:hypothetical protein
MLTKDSCQLQHLSNHGNVPTCRSARLGPRGDGITMAHIPFNKDVLVTDNGITNAIGLIFYGTKFEKKVSCNDCPFELEGHFCRSQKPIRRANIVQQTSEIIGLLNW